MVYFHLMMNPILMARNAPDLLRKVVEIDLSSTDVVNEYRQLLLKIPTNLPQFDVTENDFKIIGKNFTGVSCNKIKSDIERMDFDVPYPTARSSRVEIEELETMFRRLFRCGFKITFSGALRRVFSGMNAVQNYEVTMMRELKGSDSDLSLCNARDDNCFIAEFSLQSE